MEHNRGIPAIIILFTLTAFFHEAFSEPIPESDDTLVRQTKSGLVHGLIETTRTGKQVISFYGIPYGKAPIGDLRFKPPEPVEPWTGVFEADKLPAPCYQQHSKKQREILESTNRLLARPWSEDCLKLNIWVPNANDPEQPVIFYIHGGAFSTGTSTSSIVDSTMAVETRTVVVGVNYRLGAFGFLSLGHPEVAGNLGLLDQQLALKWVNENIEAFSGKRKAVFLFGDEAGAASAGYHVISKGSSGLFVTAVFLQGAPNCVWAYDEPGVSWKKAASLADQLGCNNENQSAMIGCLRARDPEDIVSATVGDGCDTINFKPTVDGSFLTEPPLDAIRSGRMNNVTTAYATGEDQGSLAFLHINSDILKTRDARLSRFDFRRVIKRIIPDMDDAKIRAIELEYLNWQNLDDPIMLRDAARNIYSDYLTDCCINEFVHLIAGNNYNGIRAVWAVEMNKTRDWMGALSTAQGECWRGLPLMGKNSGYTERQQQYCAAHISRLAQFFRLKAVDILAKYPPYHVDHRNYIHVKESYAFKNNYKVKQCAMWESILH